MTLNEPMDRLQYTRNDKYKNQNRTPYSFGGVVFTKLRPTLGRTHRQTDRQTKQKLYAH